MTDMQSHGDNGQYTTTFLKKKLTEASRLAAQMPDDWPLSQIDKARCNEISVNILRAEKALRFAFPEDMRPEQPARSGLSIPNDVCRVDRPQNAVISVTLPIVLPCGRSEWYSAGYRKKHQSEARMLDSELEQIVTAQLRNDIAVNGDIDVQNATLFLGFRRHIPACLNTAKVMFVDNNNVETGAITNAISRALGKGDGYHNMSFVYTAVPSEKRKIEAVLCGYEDLFHWVSPYKSEP